MKLPDCRLLFLCAIVSAGCVHTPPGTSVEVALAKRASLIRLPQPVQVAQSSRSRTSIPVIEPELPVNDRIERVAEIYMKGKAAMDEGKPKEAASAFEETVKLDPTNTDAWQNLADVYQKLGKEKKAEEANLVIKNLARQ